MIYESQSMIRPLEVDTESSNVYVYIRTNITEEETENGKVYHYTERKINKESYSLYEDVTTLKAEMAELKSYVNSIGKTELQGDGSADKPFELAIGSELIPNAYYNYNGTRYVYMGSDTTATADNLPTGNADDDFAKGWAEF